MKNNMNMTLIYEYVKIVWKEKMCQNLDNTLNTTKHEKNINSTWIHELPNLIDLKLPNKTLPKIN